VKDGLVSLYPAAWVGLLNSLLYRPGREDNVVLGHSLDRCRHSDQDVQGFGAVAVRCGHGNSSDTYATQESDSGRYNDSVNATFSHNALNNPFASSAFRWVAKGVYTSGA